MPKKEEPTKIIRVILKDKDIEKFSDIQMHLIYNLHATPYDAETIRWLIRRVRLVTI